MTRDDACTAVLNRLQSTWASAWPALDTADPQHPLYEEILALRSSGTCHLPFFSDRGQASWITIAGDADALRSAIAGLRAWIIPSFAWEDRARPVLRPSDYSGPLAGALAELAPAGYYRWHSGPAGTSVIPPRLRLWRQVQSRRPNFASAKPQGLFELREQFRLALATGDPAIADQVLNAIDERQLDTAANTLFMRTQARARFGAYTDITQEPRLAELVSLRLPQAVRSNIVHAFFEVYLRAHDERGDTESAARAFKEAVYPVIGGLLPLCRPEDGKSVERTLVYYAASTGAAQPSHDNPEQEFFDALRQGDWRTVQETGTRLLDLPDTTTSTLILRAALTESLKHRPNPHLEARLAPEHKTSSVPESWSQFIARMRAADYDSAELFLELDDRPALHTGRIAETREIVAGVEELFTDPNRDDKLPGLELLGRSLPLLIEDIVGETEFPRCPLGAAYLSLLQLWTQERATHVQPADSSVALCLAGGALQCVPDVDTQIANVLRQWWEARQVRARLPFLLEALDLLAQYTHEFGIAQGLWIEGVAFVRAQAVDLTRAERQLWRSLGRRLGFDEETLEEYLPEPAVATEEDAEDVLSVAALHKIAIVSLHEKAAQAAAVMLRERTKADVFVVSELAAGPGTKNARTADVVLLVWAATKHAVYRAFDDMRDKIAYVQGTGASSIVLSLERWVMSSRATVV
jgi:hypothetical protein